MHLTAKQIQDLAFEGKHLSRYKKEATEEEYRKYILSNYYDSNYPELTKVMYFKTTSEWYPVCFICTDGNSYIRGTISFNRESNLDLARITLGGFDDFSMSKDFCNYIDAEVEWQKLLSLKDVTLNYCHDNDYYFSN